MKRLIRIAGLASLAALALLVLRAREALAWQQGALSGWEAAHLASRMREYVAAQEDESAGDYGLFPAPDRPMDWIH